MTIDSIVNSTEEDQQQQSSGDSSLTKSSIRNDVEEKLDTGIEGETVGTNEITVANAVITGWQLNLVLVW
jgi:hypothetical protein